MIKLKFLNHINSFRGINQVLKMCFVINNQNENEY